MQQTPQESEETLVQKTLTDSDDRIVYDPEDIDLEFIDENFLFGLEDGVLDDYDSRKRITEMIQEMKQIKQKLDDLNEKNSKEPQNTKKKYHLRRHIEILSTDLMDIKSKFYSKFIDIPADAKEPAGTGEPHMHR